MQDIKFAKMILDDVLDDEDSRSDDSGLMDDFGYDDSGESENESFTSEESHGSQGIKKGNINWGI